MQDLYYYMLMLTNGDSLDDRIVSTYDNICLQHISIHIPNLFFWGTLLFDGYALAFIFNGMRVL